MKKLLLLSALFIFACNNDNSSDCEEMETIIMDCECYNDVDENGICDEDE